MIRYRCLGYTLALLAVGCAPARREPAVAKPVAHAPEQEVKPVTPSPAPPPASPIAAAEVTIPVATPPTHPITAPRRIATQLGGISLEGVAFDSRSHRLKVADQSGGPSSQWPDGQSAGQSLGGIAAINAGFFTPEGAPLGLVITSGTARGSWNGASSLGSALWFEDSSGRNGIARREKIGNASARAMRELIQAGPLLVERRSPVGGLDPIKSSPRTVLLWDGGTRWMMARSGACTLQQISQALAGSSPAGWPIASALNLDGGRSAEIWISDQVTGGGIFTRPIWNKPVRNFLVLKPANP
ncbi:MAG: phosphodiester glycosidase family protein [Luteolibacter sp.]